MPEPSVWKWGRIENQEQLSQNLWAMSAIHNSSESRVNFIHSRSPKKKNCGYVSVKVQLKQS